MGEWVMQTALACAGLKARNRWRTDSLEDAEASVSVGDGNHDED